MTPATSTQNDPPKEDPETIFARANLALARSQRLVASWLPTPTADELAITPSEEELQRQEDEMFVAVPEKLGLGAPIPSSSSAGPRQMDESSGLASNEKLRRQLLGRNYRSSAPNTSVKNHTIGSSSTRTSHFTKGFNGGSARVQDEQAQNCGSLNDNEDEDDGGRSSIIGRGKTRNDGKQGQNIRVQPLRGDDINDKQPDEEIPIAHGTDQQARCHSEIGASPKSKKRSAGNYLDELLADRSKRKKKRGK